MSEDKERQGGLVLDGHKLLWHRQRVLEWLDGGHIAPVTIDCALTRRCNYKCIYCYGKFQANDEKKMSRDVIFRFLDDAAEIGVKGVSFVSDGESSCSPHLYDAVARGRANGLDLALGTNGFLLKEEKLEELLSNLTYLRFNMSAAEPRGYAAVMGCDEGCFETVCRKIRGCVAIKKKKKLRVTIGLQMVLLPQLAGSVVPLARLGRELGVDYLVIKHCSDEPGQSLGIDYSKYLGLARVLKQAEACSTADYLVRAKWSKLMGGGKRSYSRCYGPAFLLQMSGSGLVAPCGMLFNRAYRKFHIGNITETSFKKIWKSDRYRQALNLIAAEGFCRGKICGTLCLQHKVNEFLFGLKRGTGAVLPAPQGEPPQHINFV